METASTNDMDLSVDIEERVKQADHHVIIGLDSVVHYFTFQHGVSWKDSLTTLATKMMTGRKPRFKVASITNLSWVISSQSLEVQQVITKLTHSCVKNFLAKTVIPKTFLRYLQQVNVPTATP